MDDPWLTLVAEVLLQRTKAAQAEQAFAEFSLHYPTAQSLVEAGPGAAENVTRNLGLHWRGPLLYQAAQAIAELGGQPPDSLEGLMDLPGVGPYVASAWLSLHKGKRAVIIDNNVARWLARLLGRPYDAETRRKPWVASAAGVLTPARGFREYNYAVLDFTMTVCTPRAPRCGQCPLASECAFPASCGVH